VLARCAITAGANGVFIENASGPRPRAERRPNMIPLKEMPAVLASLLKIWRVSVHFKIMRIEDRGWKMEPERSANSPSSILYPPLFFDKPTCL